ncbi:MAG: delta-60 repeat domain-containing protein [Candidatus Calescibacterium sp.]|nr:delta-60 repeat domain-containing protein [Candidatus Calescibacterium sp.]
MVIKMNGSFDEVFASSGKLMVNIDKNDYVQSLYVDSDGRIYLVGYSCNVYNYYSFVIRFNSDGNIDKSFGDSGRFVFDGDNYKKSASSLDSGAIVKSSYFDKNGKIYITGDLFRTDRKNFKDSDIFILRLLNNGKIDFSFANNGKKIITDIFSKNSKEVSNFICVYEGEIILGASAHGLSDNINYTSYTYSTSFLMVFDINGNVYKSFAENGIKKFLNVSNINYFKGIGDVFYVAAGSSLIRLKSNGTIDDSFGYKGKIVINDINFVNHKGFQEYYVGTGVMFTDIRSILYYKDGVYVTFFYYPLYRNVEYHEKVDESFILVMKVE